MSQIWRTNKRAEWEFQPLDAACYQLDAAGLTEWPDGLPETVAGRAAWLVRAALDGGLAWAVVAPPNAGLVLNGDPLCLGVAVLKDKDCLQFVLDGDISPRVYFSAERLARVEPYDAAANVTCPRCKQPIEPGQAAVQCPQCRVWHHELADKRCWTYAPRCAACQNQPTPLDAGFRWTPEEL